MHVRSEFAGSGQNTSDLFMTATVEFSFPKKCEGILRLYNTLVKEEYVPLVEPNYDEYSDYTSYRGMDDDEEGEKETLHPDSEKIADDVQKYGLQ